MRTRGHAEKDSVDRVSRPLLGVLVATVALFAVWLAALRPSSSTPRGSTHGVAAYGSAVAAAHQAVAMATAASAAHGGAVAPTAAPATVTSSAPGVSRGVHLSNATGRRLDVVQRALRDHTVVALLFYNPAAADDQALTQELALVPNDRGTVVKLAVPVSELSRYTVATSQVPINSSPTLVVIDRQRRATEVVGFADAFEIAQRVANALGEQ